METFIANVVSLFQAGADFMHNYRTAQHNEHNCVELIALCKSR